MISLTSASNKYKLDFHNKEIHLRFCELLAFRNAVNTIHIDAHFYGDHSGIEIVPLCNLKEILILETMDVLELKKTLNTIFTPQTSEILY